MSRRKPPDLWIVWYQTLERPGYRASVPCFNDSDVRMIQEELRHLYRRKGGVTWIVKTYRELAEDQ